MAGSNTGRDRAVDVVSGGAPAFLPHGSHAALSRSTQILDRWAPEEGATRQFRSLQSLALVDRRLAPYLRRANDLPQRVGLWEGIERTRHESPARARAVDARSWLFPVPWFQDELTWAKAARAARAMAPAWIAGEPLPEVTPLGGDSSSL